ncbi:MAG: NAD-dependent epimerase/dehydratase family protein [Acidobacteriota bacterium]
MKVLLTGSAGFIGFHVANHLLDRGDTVIGFDNFNEYYDPELKRRRNEMLIERDGFHLVRGDLNDLDALGEAYDKVGSGEDTRVCHLAAQAGVRHSIEHPDEFIKDNILGFQNILDFTKNREVGGLIYASSSSVYGDNKDEVLSEASDTDAQVSLYGMTKKANELQAEVYNRLFGLHVTGLRFFTVYGPWGRPDMALFLFTDAILRGNPMKVFGFGKMRRDFTYVDDIVDGIVGCLDTNPSKAVLNLGADKTEELMDFIGQIEKSCGVEGEKEFLPMQPGDVIQTRADVDLAREMIGYEPKVKIDVGVPKFVEWYREYYGI